MPEHDAANLKGVLQGVSDAATAVAMPVLFLAHPRVTKRLAEFGLADWAAGLPGMIIRDAVRYLDFLNLLAHAGLIFTDSGGVQQEACIHKVPCVTLRDNTEWTETIDIGANRLAGNDPQRITAAAGSALGESVDWGWPFGEGDSARRIVDICADFIAHPPDANT